MHVLKYMKDCRCSPKILMLRFLHLNFLFSLLMRNNAMPFPIEVSGISHEKSIGTRNLA